MVMPMVQWLNNGTIGLNANGTIGSSNGTIGSSNGTIGKPMVPLLSQWYHWLQLVKLPMVPLGNPEQSHDSSSVHKYGCRIVSIMNYHIACGFSPIGL